MRGRIEESGRRGERTLLILFYSGHADQRSLHLGGETLGLDEFKRLVEAIPSDATVAFVDACHAGQIVRGRDKGLRPTPAFDIAFHRDVGPRGRVWITSASADEVAQESDDLRSSYFTHHLASGLRGAADGDQNGQVTLAEAYSYVYNRTLATSHGAQAAVQHPELETSLAGEGQLVLSFLRRLQATLVLPGDLAGNILVLDDRNGEVVAEFEKRAGGATALALPAGRYRVQVRDGERLRTGEIELPWGGEGTVVTAALRQRPLFAALAKGSDYDFQRWVVGLAGGVGAAVPSAGGLAWQIGRSSSGG